MVYGYVSSATEHEINQKIKKLERLGVYKNNIYIENDNIKKIKLEELLNNIEEFDNVIVTDFTEVAATTEQIFKLMKICNEKRIKLTAGTFILDCTVENERTQGVLELVNLIPLFERKVIRNRIKKGVSNAKEKGKKVGRPRLTLELLPEKVKELYSLHEKGEIGTNEYARLCGISRPLAVKYLKIIKEERLRKNEEDI